MNISNKSNLANFTNSFRSIATHFVAFRGDDVSGIRETCFLRCSANLELESVTKTKCQLALDGGRRQRIYAVFLANSLGRARLDISVLIPDLTLR